MRLFAAAIGLLTLVLLPFQVAAVALRLDARRRIPVFYHRGNRVLAFRSALIGAAHDALARIPRAQAIRIQPTSIADTALHGLPLGRQHRPTVAWYGDADPISHLVGVGRRGAIDVVVTRGPVLTFEVCSDRKAVARRLEQEVRRMTARALRGRVDAERQPAGRGPDPGGIPDVPGIEPGGGPDRRPDGPRPRIPFCGETG